MSDTGLTKTSIGRKILMALSGGFLMFFLVMHVTINAISMFSPETFDTISHFMGTNKLIQIAMQPVLMLAVVFHLSMGVVLEMKNRKARTNKYALNNGAANSSWMSRNMIVTGIMILLFLLVHFVDFWIPEMVTKYANGDMTGLLPDGGMRYWHELHKTFANPVKVGIYVLAFIFLGLHLLHGFQSAFQSVGFRHKKYTPVIQKLGVLYAVLIPLTFIVIAIFHFTTQQ